MATQQEIEALRQAIIDHLQGYFQSPEYEQRALDVASGDQAFADDAIEGMVNLSVDLGELAEPILDNVSGGGSATMEPVQSGLIQWLDFTDKETLWADLSQTDLADIGDTVRAVECKSSGALFETNSVSESPFRTWDGLYFDSADYLIATLGLGLSRPHVFARFIADGTNVSGHAVDVFGGSGSTPPGRVVLRVETEDMFIRNTSGVTPSSQPQMVYWDKGPGIYVGGYDGSSAFTRRDGIDQDSVAYSETMGTGFDMMIGSDPSGNNRFVGTIAGVLLYDRELSQSEIETNEEYMESLNPNWEG